MNPVAITFINPQKEYWLSRGSNQRPPVLKSATLLTEVWGSAWKLVLLTVVLMTVMWENSQWQGKNTHKKDSEDKWTGKLAAAI